MATSCEACGGLVNESVLKCPHCGEKRAAATPTFSKAEIRAIIANEEALSASEGSSAMLKALVLPHKHTRGILRIVELVLTGVTLPAVALGALAIWFLGARRSRGAFSTTGEIAPVVVMTILGGFAMWQWFGGQYATLAVTAMWARAGIRLISAGQAERAMIEEDAREAQRLLAAQGPVAPKPLPPRPAPAPAPLPPARAITSPTTRPSSTQVPIVAAPVKGAIREPEPAPPPGDEPSILR